MEEIMRERYKHLKSLIPVMLKLKKKMSASALLHIAAFTGHLPTILEITVYRKHLLQDKCIFRGLPLHAAIKGGHKDAVKCILDMGGNTLLTNKNTPLHYAIKCKQYNIVQYLIFRGLDISAQNSYGNTPLHIAAYNGDIEGVNLLIKNGADVNYSNLRQYTPIHHAILSECKLVIMTLLSHCNTTNQDKAVQFAEDCRKLEIYDLISGELWFIRHSQKMSTLVNIL